MHSHTGLGKHRQGMGLKPAQPKNAFKDKELVEMPLRAVFFDIDNVLFPSYRFTALARENALNAMIAMGLRVPYEKLEKKLVSVIARTGPNSQSHFDILLDELKVEGRMRPRYAAAAIGAFHNTKASILPYPEVPHVLQELREKGRYSLYCASEGISVKQWDKLWRMNLFLFFDDVFVTSEFPVTGKNSEFYTIIAKCARTGPGNCVMVGDREEKDIVPAKEAGMKTVRVRRKGERYSKGPTVADAEITSLEELAKTLEKL